MTGAAARYRAALATVGEVVAAVTDWDAPTPCPGWSARHLLGHLIDAQHQVRSLLTGAGPRPPVDDVAVLAGSDPAASWDAAASEMRRVLAGLDPTAVVATPGGPMPVEQVLAIAVVEPLAHAWDLATAAGRAVVLDAEAVAATLAGVEQLGGALAASGMYAPARPTTEHTPPQARLLALLGRSPS